MNFFYKIKRTETIIKLFTACVIYQYYGNRHYG